MKDSCTADYQKLESNIIRNQAITFIAAKMPWGPSSCCSRPTDVSGSGLNLQECLT